MITFKAQTKWGEIINSALSPFTFPAGEKHIKREERRELEAIEIAVLQADENMHDDLFQLAMWNDYLLRQVYVPYRVIILPYAPAARADRGKPFGVGVYNAFIGNLDADQIIIFDPHSQVVVDDLNYYDAEVTVVNSDELFSQFYIKDNLPKYDGVIAPDKGAKDRAQAVADVLGVEVFTVNKTRDFETGKLLNFDVPELDANGRYLIVDDICDGGGTFIGIASELGVDTFLLDLYVSHGVFSKKAEENLPKFFGNIYTTNSYNPMRYFEDSDFTRFDIIRLLMDKIK